MKTKNKLTIEEVTHVAELSQLSLTQEEKEMFARQLSDILNYIKQLDELNTDDVTPTSQVTGLVNVTRNDETKPSLSENEVLQNAPDKNGNLFKVKAVFER